MDVRVLGTLPPDPFLGARDLLTTEYDLAHPVYVRIRNDPDERTWVAHHDDRHVLNISRQAATSAMARELVLHEYAHMTRHEQRHPSHTQSTREAIYLGLAGRSVEKRKIAHCYQIANHMKDIYADDITLRVGPTDKLVSFFESQLAMALASAPGVIPAAADGCVPDDADPEITVVNAAFALALVERHDLVEHDHRIYDLAHAAASDAPTVSLQEFKQHFASLARDPSESDYRKALVDVTRTYATGGAPAAD